ncbi:MAG: bacterial transcriptional activator domain-containing protein [Chloroflexi bacterium]|nr:bacterial transcriptional activator domain-containing protein [Chloroflexota bacterium]MCI0575355.1 bacterial transcriptional activator domain-containing protein [Chloroflexota bacterium]MCI0645829.1 bacterial transcriptional activator domain-containing protein [Chloroflexota bacterium]MCI0730959.1 bacterial transcriptional activator domain-containing protein [Chloroflexota bacterium]
MSILSISLFGKVHICWSEHTLCGLEARKAQELFCYLLLYRERPHCRETLSGLLWGGNSATQSKKYLRQALWQLQTTLDSGAESGHCPLLLVEADWIQLNPEAALWLDVAEFEQASTLAQGIAGRELDSQMAQALQAAVQLYQGDLLEGWYQDWCLFERERLQNMYLDMLNKLMDYCVTHQEYEAGLAYGMRILRCDQAHEPTHRQLMRLQYLAGNRTAALRQYERCVAALNEELGVGPARNTVALYEQLCADTLSGAWVAPAGMAPDTTTGAPTEPAAIPLFVLFTHLQQLRLEVAHIQYQLEQAIQAVELTLSH